LFVFEQDRVLYWKLLSDSLAQHGRNFDNRVSDFLEWLLVEVLEVVQDGFSSAACSCTCLDDVNLLKASAFLAVHFMCPANVLSDCHAVVGLEYLAGSEPCVFRVLFDKLSLVIIEADQLLEINGRLELAYLIVLELMVLYLFCRNNLAWGGKACHKWNPSRGQKIFALL
jgi:hypothetical protein